MSNARLKNDVETVLHLARELREKTHALRISKAFRAEGQRAYHGFAYLAAEDCLLALYQDCSAAEKAISKFSTTLDDD